ncbi:MAG: hypothetical protein ACYTDU_05475 [Planctomycetota bacterium]|jgi:hypothetical protein
MSSLRRNAHRARAALFDHLRAHRHDELPPVESCAACNRPLIAGAQGVDLHPRDGGPRQHWCAVCALTIDGQRDNDGARGTA